MTFQVIAAADTGSGNLVVGLLLGLCIGLLVGPAFRSWLVLREWSEVSREAKLADQLLTKIETDVGEDPLPSGSTDERPGTPARTERRTPAAWPTSR